MSKISARLFVLFQWILPQHSVTSVVYWLARRRNVTVKNFLIRQFVKAYKVNVEELAATYPEGFATFNAFFTRDLRRGARPIDNAPHAIVSPVDGTVSAAGSIDAGTLIQAKGIRYGIEDLLATDLHEADAYANGHFVTIYLAPCNYHRVHAPLSGTLRAVRFVPGDLYSVNATTAALVPGLFRRNQRLICHFTTEHGPYALIFVGALNVGSISTPWSGEIKARKRGVVVDLDLSVSAHSRQVDPGDLLGWFNMGSTVIMLLPNGAGRWTESLVSGTTLRMGEAIGTLDAGSDG